MNTTYTVHFILTEGVEGHMDGQPYFPELATYEDAERIWQGGLSEWAGKIESAIWRTSESALVASLPQGADEVRLTGLHRG